jgi:hypothetical protein
MFSSEKSPARTATTTAKKMMMTKATATESDYRASPVESKQPQTLERGASRSSTDVRHNGQFQYGDIRIALSLGLQLGDEVQRQHILLGRLEPGHGAELAQAVWL